MKKRSDPLSKFLNFAVKISALMTVFVLVVIVAYIIIKGLPHLTLDQFAWTYNTDNVSMMPAILNTLLTTALALLIAIPFGVSSAIYLVEYAKKGSRFVQIVRITTETLQGIPSIVFGLFGYLMFLVAFGWKNSLLAGIITIAIMILPVIMRTSEEALKAVPDSYREGSFGLGAGKLRTIFRIILPTAIPGILSGVILSIGRIVGESAALVYTAGTIPQFAYKLIDSGRTLSVHMFALMSEGLYMDEAYSTAFVLLIFVMIINAISQKVAKKIGGSI